MRFFVVSLGALTFGKKVALCQFVTFRQTSMEYYFTLTEGSQILSISVYALRLCLLILVLTRVVLAAPGAVHRGRFVDVSSGKLLVDQVIVFDENGTATAVGAATSTDWTARCPHPSISPLPPVFRD
jgi:hypothetical protein